MKRILLVSHSQKTGGAEKCLFEAAVGLREAGYDINVLIPSKGELNVLFEHHGFRVIVNSFPWWVHFNAQKFGLLKRIRKIISLFSYTARQYQVLSHLEPDIILSNTLCNPCVALAAKIKGIKHFWFIHEYGKEDHGLVFDLGFYAASKIIGATAHHVFVNAETIRQKFSKYININKISVVNYNIPKPLTESVIVKKIDPNSFVLLLVGQINANKGQLDAVEALYLLIEKGLECSLIIIGQVSDNEYHRRLVEFIDSKKITSYVRLVSHIANPYDLIHGFTIGLMCSQWEALGRVTIEYMKLGIPVIGANSSTTAKLITNHYNGIYYELRNPRDLAKQIELLIQDQQKLDLLTNNAARYASETFNNHVFIDGLLKQLQ